MDRSLASVLTDTLEAAQLQLQAARQLNSDGLAVATANRQDLQFELELMRDETSWRVDEEIGDIVRELRATDQRLMSVLGAANSVFRNVLQPHHRQLMAHQGKSVSASHVPIKYTARRSNWPESGVLWRRGDRSECHQCKH